MAIRITPLIRRIMCSLTSRVLVPVNIRATAIYHKASIKAAVIPITTVSVQLEPVRMIWLNIARKNTAIFGFSTDIRKPSTKPLNNT